MRYPVDQRGLIIPPYELGFNPPEMGDFKYRQTTNHHGYWTRRQYGRSAIHHTFRNLVDHVTPLKVKEHQALHEKYSPPVMPHVGLMIDVLDEYMALNGVINVVREKATNQVNEIDSVAWTKIRLMHNT